MAKQYTFWYDEIYTYKAWFEAKDDAEAQRLYDKVFMGEMDIEDLPGFGKKDKEYQVDLGELEND